MWNHLSAMNIKRTASPYFFGLSRLFAVCGEDFFLTWCYNIGMKITGGLCMDAIKMGKFLASLRQEAGLTQEQLAEELGTTNKTVSRWECGNYMPPVEMLELLSRKYGVTINEIIAGQRLDESGYREKAEENLKSAISDIEDSPISYRERLNFFIKKWDKEHRAEKIAVLILLLAMLILAILFKPNLTWVAPVLAAVYSIIMTMRKYGYAEMKAFRIDERLGGAPEGRR